MAFATNPNLPLSRVRPTVAVAIDAQAPAGTDAQEANTVLVWGEVLPGGSQPVNAPFKINSISDAINGAGGKKSILARGVRALLSQPGVAGNIAIYGVGVNPPSSGTAATFSIVVNVLNPTTMATATNPAQAGGVTLTMGGTELASVAYTTADTNATIASALLSQLQALEWCPFTFSLNTATITATANVAGAALEDYPIRVSYTKPGTGVYLGPGSLTVTSAPGHAGTASVATGTLTAQATVVGNEADAYHVALLIESAINASDFPLIAATPTNAAPSVMPLLYNPGRDVRRVSAFVTSVTTTTLTLTGGSATDGTGSASSITYNGTTGAGYPSVSTAVANVAGSGSFGEWVHPWVNDATTTSALFSSVVTQGDGADGHQKGQHLMACNVGSESTAAAFLSTTSPPLSAATSMVNEGLRAVMLHCPDAAVPGFEIATRVAGLRASVASSFYNYDGAIIAGNVDVPCPLPSKLAQAAYSPDTQNQAIRDGLTPIAVQGGQLTIVFGRNCISTTAPELWDWSWIDQADDHRLDLRSQAVLTFQGCALIADGTLPQSRNDVDTNAIKAFLRSMLRRWEAQGTYDGAKALADAVQAQINPSQRSRADLTYPESPKVPLHTLGVVAQRSAPSA